MIRILSYGGGLDSFAMLVDSIQAGSPPDVCIFADVGSPRGDDGEWPSTYRHIREVAIPLCDREGIEFVWIDTDDYPIRGAESLLAYFEKKRLIPSSLLRMCTVASKVERIEDYLSDNYPGDNFEVWIGFEANEEHRAARDPHHAKASKTGRMNRFPLIERKLCRCRCEDLVRQAGLPIPRKSACMFCAHGSKGDFKTLAIELPDVFERICRLEENCRLTRSGKRIYIKHESQTLREYVLTPYNPRVIPCEVCGRPQRATKATGCTYLPNPARIRRLMI